jgi:hypothetical protein
MSALTPKADIDRVSRDVRYVPEADKVQCSKKDHQELRLNLSNELSYDAAGEMACNCFNEFDEINMATRYAGATGLPRA